VKVRAGAFRQPPKWNAPESFLPLKENGIEGKKERSCVWISINSEALHDFWRLRNRNNL
jgi:hypothetical protein